MRDFVEGFNSNPYFTVNGDERCADNDCSDLYMYICIIYNDISLPTPKLRSDDVHASAWCPIHIPV